MWLFLETILFYTFMLSTTVFILYRQFSGSFFPTQQSDIKKIIQDFLHYASINLSWFNINFVLCVMPLIVLLYVNPHYNEYYDHDEEEKGLDLSYLIWALWVCHVIQFATKIQIFTDRSIRKINEHETTSLTTEENDDHFKNANVFSLNNAEGEDG